MKKNSSLGCWIAQSRNRCLVLVIMLLVKVGAQAQNLQVFYDTERGCVTSTLEMFRPDAFGSYGSRTDYRGSAHAGAHTPYPVR